MTLWDFFASYFHQDWMLDDATADDVVARFLADINHDATVRAQLAGAIRAFIARFTDDNALRDALYRELGAFYDPRADGLSGREWLQRVADQIEGKSSR